MRDTLVIRIDGGLGRVIAMTGAITEVAKKRKVKVVTSWPLVFWGNPYIQSVHGLDDRGLFQNVIKGCDYIELEPYTDANFFNDAENWLITAARQLGLPADNIPQPVLFLADYEKVNNVLCTDCKPVLFQPFGSTMGSFGGDKSYRSLPVESAQSLAYILHEEGYTPYLVIKPGQPTLQYCETLDTPDLRYVVSLCDRYPVIGCDSCLHHAAKAFGKQSLVVWGGTDKERFGYDSHINMREFPMVAHTPMRLPMNDFNFDIINQNTNKFTKKFIGKVADEALKLCKKFYE